MKNGDIRKVNVVDDGSFWLVDYYFCVDSESKIFNHIAWENSFKVRKITSNLLKIFNTKECTKQEVHRVKLLVSDNNIN